MTALPEHNLYDGRYLAFAGSFLGRSNHLLSAEEKQAAAAMRDAFTYRFAREGGYAVALMLDVERKALAAIEKHGHERYIAQVRAVTEKAT